MTTQDGPTPNPAPTRQQEDAFAAVLELVPDADSAVSANQPRRASAAYRELFGRDTQSRESDTATASVPPAPTGPNDSCTIERPRLASAGYREFFGSAPLPRPQTPLIATIVRPRKMFWGDPDRQFMLWLPHAAVRPDASLPWAGVRALARALPLLLLIVAASAVHAVNMFGAPFYFDDEGIYMSQAWSVATSGELAPYTYFYDHPPLGWFTIAAWVTAFGGFEAFGASVNAGRVLMLVVHAGSTWLVYQNVRRLGGSAFAGVAALALFALSPFQIIFGREVLLDNLAAFWMLLSLYFATERPLRVNMAAVSGLAMGIALLNKEIVGPMLPGLLLIVYLGITKEVRWIGVSAWIFTCLGVASIYPLFAFFKGELFPYGSILDFSSTPHVSLVDAVLFHGSRASDHGIFEPGSYFWEAAGIWWRTDPALVVATLGALVAAVLLARSYQGLLGVGFMLAFMLAFLARGGVVFDFWLVSAVPLVAIITGITAGHALKHLPLIWRSADIGSRFVAAASIAMLATLAATVVVQRESYADAYQRVFTHDETRAQAQALTWVNDNIDQRALLVIDTYAYVDLQQFDNAHSFWKVDLDPSITQGVFFGDWRRIDYIVLTPAMSAPIGAGELPLIAQALDHSVVVARFESSGNWVEIRRVQPNDDAAASGGR